jgi:FkbM family methyltransferase
MFLPLKLLTKLILSRLNRIFIGKAVTGLLIETNQGQFVVSPEDFGVGRWLLKNLSYGLDELNLIYKFSNPSDQILFVGAHIGSLVIPVSTKVRHITAIEANPNTFKLFLMNIFLNERKNITPLHLAASDKKEFITFLLSKVNSGGSKRMPKFKKFMYFFDKPDSIKVKADRLDNVLKVKFDSIFMDIEGSEFFALKGMPKLLSHSKYLFIEFLPHHLKNISGITVSEFLGCISPFFSYCYIPSKKMMISRVNFSTVFQSMYDKNEHDYAIVFSKKKININI